MNNEERAEALLCIVCMLPRTASKLQNLNLMINVGEEKSKSMVGDRVEKFIGRTEALPLQTNAGEERKRWRRRNNEKHLFLWLN